MLSCLYLPSAKRGLEGSVLQKKLHAHTPYPASSFDSTGSLFFNWINF